MASYGLVVQTEERAKEILDVFKEIQNRSGHVTLNDLSLLVGQELHRSFDDLGWDSLDDFVIEKLEDEGKFMLSIPQESPLFDKEK